MKHHLTAVLILTIALLGSNRTCAQNKVIYPYLMNPTEHPDYLRHYVKAPDYSVFGNRTHFISLRNLRGSDYKERMTQWVDQCKLGDFLWPHYTFIYQDNLKELVAEIKKRKMNYGIITLDDKNCC